MRLRRISALALVGALVSLSPAAEATRPETLFPQVGHAGVDVRSYHVALTYDPATNHVAATTTIIGEAAARLSRISLDLEGLTVSAVSVDGMVSTWARRGTTLVVTPPHPVADRVTIRVTYAGTPTRHIDADDSPEGWVPTSDGAVALGEPLGTMDWIPCDNTPGDKARFSYDITVPSGYQVEANGTLRSHTSSTGTEEFAWAASEPMSTYLASIAIGHFRVHVSSYHSIDGRRIPLRSYVDTASDPSTTALAALPKVLAFEEQKFGHYPFSTSGLVIDNGHVGYALETQTRPYFDGGADVGTLVHELAHQWYGDSVTLRDWHDIWLAEGFATYAEWLWDAAHGGRTPAQHFADLYSTPASSDLWHPAPRGFTDSADLFGSPVYNRGAMTLQVLRRRIGDHDFSLFLHRWAALHRHGNATTAQLITLAERISGKHLDHLFEVWLDHDGKPAGY